MVDIHALKDFLNIIPYLRADTWYMLGTGSIVYVIYIAYLMAFERYYKSREFPQPQISMQASIRERIAELSPDDTRFFEKLSLLIRSHLEETSLVPFATKKTQKEIERTHIEDGLKEILGICAHYEYTGEEASREKREAALYALGRLL